MKRSIVSALFGLVALSAFAQDIALPQPAARVGVDLIAAIKNRSVTKTFVKKEVPIVDLSTILWAGLGSRSVDAVTSATKANRNVSFSGDNAYINVYVLTEKGTWKYLPEKNILQFKSGNDARTSVSRAAVPQAAFMVLFTVDNALMPPFLKSNPDLFRQMANATAGFAAQNMELTASALKLSSVVQYTLAPAGAAAAAALGKDEVPLFILQAGFTQ